MRAPDLCRGMVTCATNRPSERCRRRRVLRVDVLGGSPQPGFDVLVDARRCAATSGPGTQLVERLQRVAWRAIGGFDLSPEDRKDAFAGTFFRLYERLDTIREPAKLPGWVATTARNEVHALLRGPAARRARWTSTTSSCRRSTSSPARASSTSSCTTPCTGAWPACPSACRQLLHLLTIDPPLSYAEVGDLLDLPHGSIGPTRQRCLDRLRATPELRPFLEEAPR